MRWSTFACAATLAAWPLLAVGTASGERPATPADVIAGLNTQREANGLPGGLFEDPVLSRGCRLHVRYLELNARPGWTTEQYHNENPRLPGYTTLGAKAGASGPLNGEPGAHAWRRGINGFRGAPFHEMSTLAPLVQAVGWATSSRDGLSGHSCLALSDSRPSPREPTVFTYPGDGSRIYAAEIAAEMPYTPLAVLGVPATTLTGPHLMIWAVGSEPTPDDVEASVERLERARLDGPDGPIPVGVVDATTRGPKGQTPILSGSGMIIPLRPLRPRSAYQAAVTVVYDGWKAMTHTWEFETTAAEIDWSTIGILQDPGIVMRGPDRRSNAGAVRLTISAGKAAGRRAVMTSHRVSARCPNPDPRGRPFKYCHAERRVIVLRPSQQILVPREPDGQFVTVTVDRFATGAIYQTYYREFSWATTVHARGCTTYRCTIDGARTAR